MPIWRLLARVESGLIAACAGAALVLACYTVIARYVAPQFTVDWALDVIVMVIVWGVFIAGGRTARHRAHIRVDLFVDLAPRGLARLMAIATAVVVIGVAGLLIWSGVLVVEESIRWDERSTSTWRIPMWIYYLSLPVGMVSIAIQALIGILSGAAGGHGHLWTEGGE